MSLGHGLVFRALLVMVQSFEIDERELTGAYLVIEPAFRRPTITVLA